jgi:hypothetical protein
MVGRFLKCRQTNSSRWRTALFVVCGCKALPLSTPKGSEETWETGQVAHRQCVEQGFQPGTPLNLQCRQIAANREAAQEAAQQVAYADMMAVGGLR